jgi:hypothetical protein
MQMGVHVWQSAMTVDTYIYAPLRQPAHRNSQDFMTASWQNGGCEQDDRQDPFLNKWASSSYVHQARKKLQGMRAC